MKILHTADWHLNDRLGRIDRTDHLRARVEEVSEICEREQVDVLVIAGDVFSEQAEVSYRVNHVAESLRHLRRTFTRFFQRGGLILAVTGNHDQHGNLRPALDVARGGLDLDAPPRAWGSHFSPGRMYLLDHAFVGRVRDPREVFDIQFALLPFPNISRVLKGTETASTPAELNRPTQEEVAEWVRTLPNKQGFDADLRTVLVAHLSVTGADINRGRFRLGEESDVVLSANAVPTAFDYVALGHVHKPQCLGGLPHVRYSGSLDRLDFGDHDEIKQVVLVEIGQDGRRGDPTPIPITPTRLVEVTIDDPDRVREQLAAVPDPATAIVQVRVEPEAALAGMAIDLAIRDSLPNWTIRLVPPDAPATTNNVIEPTSGSIRDRVLTGLANRLVDDPDRSELLTLASDYLEREGYT